MSKIVVINGSPRKNGNTSRMVSALVDEAGRKGSEVKVFEVGGMKLDGCRACCRCFGNGKACVCSDIFNDIVDSIESSDSIVLAMPVYWYSIPGQIKNNMDFRVCGRADSVLSSIRGRKEGCFWEEVRLDLML